MTTELDRVRAAYRPLDAPVPPKTLARLDALIAAAEHAATGAPPPRRRARRRRPLLLAGAAGGLGVALVAALALLPGGSRTPQPATARAACVPSGAAAGTCARALGALAGRRSVPGAGHVLYRRGSYVVVSFTVTAAPGGTSSAGHPGPNVIRLPAAHRPFTVVRDASEELWLTPDGAGRFAHSDPGPARLQSAADDAAWRAAGSPDLEALVPPRGHTERPLVIDVAAGAANDTLLGASGLYDFLPHHGDPLAPIPRQPRALTAWLRQRAFKERAAHDPGCHPDGGGCTPVTRRLMADVVVGDIETLLAYPATPPRLRAALVQVLGERPGARSLGVIRDGAGREVAAISLGQGASEPDGAGVVAFDPDTGELRGIAVTDGHDVRWLRMYAIDAARVKAVGDRL
jgi:hypothetical protein